MHRLSCPLRLILTASRSCKIALSRPTSDRLAIAHRRHGEHLLRRMLIYQITVLVGTGCGREMCLVTTAPVTLELCGLVLAHYVARVLMHGAAVQGGVARTQLSFGRSIESIRQAIVEFQIICRGRHAALRVPLCQKMATLLSPNRRLRTAPPVIKRRPSEFLCKRACHSSVPLPRKPTRKCMELIV